MDLIEGNLDIIDLTESLKVYIKKDFPYFYKELKERHYEIKDIPEAMIEELELDILEEIKENGQWNEDIYELERNKEGFLTGNINSKGVSAVEYHEKVPGISDYATYVIFEGDNLGSNYTDDGFVVIPTRLIDIRDNNNKSILKMWKEQLNYFLNDFGF